MSVIRSFIIPMTIFVVITKQRINTYFRMITIGLYGRGDISSKKLIKKYILLDLRIDLPPYKSQKYLLVLAPALLFAGKFSNAILGCRSLRIPKRAAVTRLILTPSMFCSVYIKVLCGSVEVVLLPATRSITLAVDT